MPTKKPMKKPAPKRAARPAAKQPARKPAAPKPVRKPAPKPTRSTAKEAGTKPAKTPRLLAGDNPQIAKGDGDAPVQAYIAAIPGWKQEVARRLDALIATTVPGVRKAVKWNSPFYGAGTSKEDGWFLSFHCFANYVKVAFFRGADLKPLPPGTSSQKNVRYLDIREADPFDVKQIAAWVKQASEAG
jgi:hypothetical protein